MYSQQKAIVGKTEVVGTNRYPQRCRCGVYVGMGQGVLCRSEVLRIPHNWTCKYFTICQRCHARRQQEAGKS